MKAGLHGDAVDRLGTAIASGELRPGHVLTLAEVARDLGVSRTVAREAVRVLEAMGMVESRRRVGLTITAPERWEALDPQLIRWRLAGPGRASQLVALTELRAAIEPLAARLAASRATPEQRAELTRLAARLCALGEARRGSEPEYLETDSAFHRLLLEASGNPMLAALTDAVAEVLAGRTALGLSPSSPVPDALDDHEATAGAVARGDADTAERRARSVVMEVWAEVRAATSGHDRPA
jgi:DNA-binding FadR family transcriptional regulator